MNSFLCNSLSFSAARRWQSWLCTQISHLLESSVPCTFLSHCKKKQLYVAWKLLTRCWSYQPLISITLQLLVKLVLNLDIEVPYTSPVYNKIPVTKINLCTVLHTDNLPLKTIQYQLLQKAVRTSLFSFPNQLSEKKIPSEIEQPTCCTLPSTNFLSCNPPHMQNDTGTAKAVLRTPNEQKNQPQRKQKALPESEKAISLYK